MSVTRAARYFDAYDNVTRKFLHKQDADPQ